MKNKELFTLNPDDNNLINDGVVEINTARDDQGLKIIRHELKTFVCEGEYQRGLFRILDTYLKNIDQPKQPAVWVSGFFGSGKSHLVKILGYLWEDFQFPNKETARSIKQLPQDIQDLLVELDRRQKVHGRLSVSGTLKDFPSADIRYSFLKLFLHSLGLPQQFHLFKFVHWTKQEGIYDDLKALLDSQGKDLNRELGDLFVSSSIARAILELRPGFAANEVQVREFLKANFRRTNESISREELINTIRQDILPMRFGDKIPLTVIVLDEVQQFIGLDSDKSIDVQNLAQDICSSFDGKFLLIGTGQNALSDTSMLQRLQDRFTVKVSLSDTDVETVTRKTVLEKKASAVKAIDEKLDGALGEIARCLSGTEFGYTTADRSILVADYPILPPTRKFWKKVLQVIDKAGTSGQLRSQLRIVDESIKYVANKELGCIVPADLVFEQKQQQLLQNAILLNETNELIQSRKAKGGDDLIKGRILSMVFLITQIQEAHTKGIRSDSDTIADLLLDDLNANSGDFRNLVKKLILELVEEKVLMPIGDEFRLQTREGQEWEQEFTAHVVKLNNAGADQLMVMRRERIMAYFSDKTKSINILQGTSRQKREFDLWDKDSRPSTDNRLILWVRDGWNENEAAVMDEIRSEGTDSPLAYAYVRKQREQELNAEITKYLAARQTIESKGLPGTPEAEQARKGMETRQTKARLAIDTLIEQVCKEALILLAGGSKETGGSLRENVEQALMKSADRQFPQFAKADFKDWDKALRSAFAGDPDALRKTGWDKDVKDHPMAVEMLRFLGNQSRQGKEIRSQFIRAPYGWSQDAIDTVLVMLKNTEHISTKEPALNQAKISGAEFRKEVHTLTAPEKIKLRKLFQEGGVDCKPNEESLRAVQFLQKLKELAGRISGEAPLPEGIDLKWITDVENLDGNERLLRLLEEEYSLRKAWQEWSEAAERVKVRLPRWQLLEGLSHCAESAGGYDQLVAEVEALRANRLLLHDPDPVEPLLAQLTTQLREAMNGLKQRYADDYDARMTALQKESYFSQLTPEDKHRILVKNQLLAKPDIKSPDAEGLLLQLQKVSLTVWQTKIAALPGQFQSALEEAIQLSAPQVQTYSLPRTTITSQAEIEKYIADLKAELEELVKRAGSVILK
jgi:hypothetical protein